MTQVQWTANRTKNIIRRRITIEPEEGRGREGGRGGREGEGGREGRKGGGGREGQKLVVSTQIQPKNSRRQE